MKSSLRSLNRFIEMAKAATLHDSSARGSIDSLCVTKAYGDDSLSESSRKDKANQEAYNFLHRSTHRHSDLGGYGEDFGFHYPPRAFVDPDSPHIYPFYNRWHQCANLRESRYSHHRRMLHSLDIAKLVRHGRLLPLPHKLLNDYLMSKVPLRDSDCAAFFDYAHLILIKTTHSNSSNGADQESYFTQILDMFERLLATKLPPSEVGAKAHAAVIRCCAQLQKFTEGYQWFRQRARSIGIEHTVELYDSILELCEKCGETAYAWKEFESMLKEKAKVPPITLCRMLRIAASEASYEMGRDVWELFNFYGHKKNGSIYEAGLEWISECQGKGREALQMMAEMKHLFDSQEQHPSSNTSNHSTKGTYDRFSSKIIQNNQGAYFSGISLFNPENQTYSNNHSIAEYEAGAFMKSLQPTPLMILSTLYCLIRTDKEAFRLSWKVFLDHFVGNGIGDSSSGSNTLLKSVPPETITYMFFGAALHTEVEISSKLDDIVKSSPMFAGKNIMTPDALYYRIQTLRKYFEAAGDTPIFPDDSYSREANRNTHRDCFESIASSHRLTNLLKKSRKGVEINVPARKVKNIRHGQVKQFVTLTYDVPILARESQEAKRSLVITDISNFVESPFRSASPKKDMSLASSSFERMTSEKDTTMIEYHCLPEQIAKDIQVTEARFPRSVYDEWIHTEYIGTLSAFPWSLENTSNELNFSYIAGFRKALSAAKKLTSKNYSLNTRVIFYLLRVLRRYAVELQKSFTESREHKSAESPLSQLDAHSEILYNRVDEVLHIIGSHRSCAHFIGCDKIRHEMYRILDFFEWLSQQRVSREKGSYSALTNTRWQRMALKSDNIFQRDPKYVITKMYSSQDSDGTVDKVQISSESFTSKKNSKKLLQEWESYQEKLWGSDPDAPPAPRRSEKVTSFHFSREDKALCKFGQRLASPKTQSSF